MPNHPISCEDHDIHSSEGVQQGDPVGPLLFCLTTHPMLLKLWSVLKVFYLDDGTLGSSLEDVLCDLKMVEREAAALGLQLNHARYKLISNYPGTRHLMMTPSPYLASAAGCAGLVSSILPLRL